MNIAQLHQRLPNANAMLSAMKKAARSSRRNDTHVLGVVTVYNSSEMCSAFGFVAMDECMLKLAVCAAANLPVDAQVFRIGTEQIGFLAASGAEGIPAILSYLNASFRQPLLYHGIPIHIDTRIGYVSISGFREEVESYLRKAQAASLQASRSGHDIAAYETGSRTLARENLVMLGELIGGMEREEVHLHYQPKVSLRSGAVIGAEALIRWNHPVRGRLAPGVFIPRAEQSTLIHALTEFALERAIRQAVAWRDAGMHVPVAVNVSSRNLMQPGFSATVLRTLARFEASANLLELEVTEGALIGDVDCVAAELHRLADLGVQIAIDDFGTGYSSLTYLDRLPVSIVKIDQSFIRRLHDEESTIDIVDAVVSVAHKKGVHIVAEGVESQAAYNTLRNLGCDIAQGYVIARPMPASGFEQWYRAWQGADVLLQQY